MKWDKKVKSVFILTNIQTSKLYYVHSFDKKAVIWWTHKDSFWTKFTLHATCTCRFHNIPKHLIIFFNLRMSILFAVAVPSVRATWSQSGLMFRQVVCSHQPNETNTTDRTKNTCPQHQSDKKNGRNKWLYALVPQYLYTKCTLLQHSKWPSPTKAKT